MSRMNIYLKDILLIIVLIALQLGFTLIFPLRPTDAGGQVTVSRQLLILTFEFSDGTSRTYFPFLTLLFTAFLVGLLIPKQKRLSLIYGFGLVLVGKFSFVSQIYALEGTHATLTTESITSKMVYDQTGALVAQDLTFYILLAFLVIKIGIYAYEYFYHHKDVKQPTNQNIEA